MCSPPIPLCRRIRTHLCGGPPRRDRPSRPDHPWFHHIVPLRRYAPLTNQCSDAASQPPIHVSPWSTWTLPTTPPAPNILSSIRSATTRLPTTCTGNDPSPLRHGSSASTRDAPFRQTPNHLHLRRRSCPVPEIPSSTSSGHAQSPRYALGGSPRYLFLDQSITQTNHCRVALHFRGYE